MPGSLAQKSWLDEMREASFKSLTAPLLAGAPDPSKPPPPPTPAPEPAPFVSSIPDAGQYLSRFEDTMSTAGSAVAGAASASGDAVSSLIPDAGSYLSRFGFAPELPPSAAGQAGASAPTSAPAVPGAASRGGPVPSAAPLREEDPGDLEVWARQEAIRLGIDPDIAVRVAAEGEGGFADPVRQSDIVDQGQREQSYGPYQLNVTGGLGTEALARGIDPRNPRHARAAITYALEHAAQNGWGNFHGAARIGIGPWDGIGGQPAQAASQVSVQVAPRQQPAPQAAPQGQQPQQGGAYGAGSWTPNQYDLSKAEGLDDETAWAVCGPAAAIAFARRTGRNPTMQEALGLARQVGWTVENGMAGPASQKALLDRMGIASRLEDGVDWAKVRADVERGNPVIINATGHYMVAERYDPETGAFDFGQSAAVLRAAGGRRWFRPDELPGLSTPGLTIAPRSTLYLDNPASPAPSVAAGRVGQAAPSPAQPQQQQAAPATGLPPTVAQRWRDQFGRDPSPEEMAELVGVIGGFA